MKTLKELLETNSKNPNTKYKLFCDMDGVLCDFDARFEHFTGMHPREYENKYGQRKFYDLINKEVGMKFWSEMPWTPKGKELWNFIKDYKPALLTSPTGKTGSEDRETSMKGKSQWVAKNLGSFRVIFAKARDKHIYSGKNRIHIDDRQDTIERWIERGGIGIYHPPNVENIEPIINELQHYL